MASSKVYTCDGCGVARQESNHWHLALVRSEGLVDSITIQKWDDNLANESRYKHLCGIGCSTKLLSATAEAWR
jgi:hypothetical protein